MALKLLLVGGGRMGSALLTGLLAGGWAPVEDLAVSEPDQAQRRRLADAHPGLTVVDGPIGVPDAVLAVKPELAEAVLRTLAAAGVRRVLSIVAGVSAARLEAALDPGSVVVRSMPNTPSLIGAGVAGLSGGSMATAGDLDWAEGILGAVGTILGSARMMAETDEEPADLRAAVTSPGGTTAAAVRTLEFKAVRSAFIEAVAAATERSRQMGR